jgi:hypothetical protein
MIGAEMSDERDDDEAFEPPEGLTRAMKAIVAIASDKDHPRVVTAFTAFAHLMGFLSKRDLGEFAQSTEATALFSEVAGVLEPKASTESVRDWFVRVSEVMPYKPLRNIPTIEPERPN